MFLILELECLRQPTLSLESCKLVWVATFSAQCHAKTSEVPGLVQLTVPLRPNLSVQVIHGKDDGKMLSAGPMPRFCLIRM